VAYFYEVTSESKGATEKQKNQINKINVSKTQGTFPLHTRRLNAIADPDNFSTSKTAHGHVRFCTSHFSYCFIFIY